MSLNTVLEASQKVLEESSTLKSMFLKKLEDTKLISEVAEKIQNKSSLELYNKLFYQIERSQADSDTVKIRIEEIQKKINENQEEINKNLEDSKSIYVQVDELLSKIGKHVNNINNTSLEKLSRSVITDNKLDEQNIPWQIRSVLDQDKLLGGTKRLYTPFRITDAQCNVAFSLKSAHKMGKLNQKRCKKTKKTRKRLYTFAHSKRPRKGQL